MKTIPSPQSVRLGLLLCLGTGLLACGLLQSPTSPGTPTGGGGVPTPRASSPPSPTPPGVETHPPEPLPATPTAVAAAPSPTTIPESLPTRQATPSADPFGLYPSGEPAPVWSVRLRMSSSTTGWALLRETADSPGHRVFRTMDGGQTWYDRTPIEPPGGISQAVFLDGEHAWAIQPGEAQTVVWQTDDGGTAWQPGEPLELPNPWGATLTFLDTHNGWLFAGEPVGMHKVPTTIYRTTDGGRTWQSVYADSPGQEGVLFSGYKTEFSFQDATLGWAGVSSPYVLPEIVTTRDGGRSWEHRFLPPPPPFTERDIGDCDAIAAPWVFPNHTVMMVTRCWVGVEARRYLYTTQDGGQGWRIDPLPGIEGPIEFVSARAGWMIALQDLDRDTSEFFRTSDGGQTWTFLRQVNWRADQLDFVSDQEGWAVIRKGETLALVRTRDSGGTWEMLRPRMIP